MGGNDNTKNKIPINNFQEMCKVVEKERHQSVDFIVSHVLRHYKIDALMTFFLRLWNFERLMSRNFDRKW